MNEEKKDQMGNEELDTRIEKQEVNEEQQDVSSDPPEPDDAQTEASDDPIGPEKKKLFPLDKKQKKIALIVVGALVLTALAIFFAGYGDRKAYKEAGEFMAGKDFAKAQEALAPLVEKDYKDSKLFSEYIEGRRYIALASQKIVTAPDVNSKIGEDLKTAEAHFVKAGEYENSKEYVAFCKASQEFTQANGFPAETKNKLVTGYEAAGGVENSDLLIEFVKAMSEARYEAAAKAAKEYRAQKGFLLNTKKLTQFACWIPNQENLKASQKLKTALQAANAMFAVDNGVMEEYSKMTTNIVLKSSKVPGVGAASKDSILIMLTGTSYVGNKDYEISLGNTAKLKARYFPQNLSDVRYIIRLHENSKSSKTFSGGGKTVPGLTESMYCELYDVKKKKVIYKSQTKNGPALKNSYTFYGYTPLIITAEWPGKWTVKEKLIKQAAAKIPGYQK